MTRLEYLSREIKGFFCATGVCEVTMGDSNSSVSGLWQAHTPYNCHTMNKLRGSTWRDFLRRSMVPASSLFPMPPACMGQWWSVGWLGHGFYHVVQIKQQTNRWFWRPPILQKSKFCVIVWDDSTWYIWADGLIRLSFAGQEIWPWCAHKWLTSFVWSVFCLFMTNCKAWLTD